MIFSTNVLYFWEPEFLELFHVPLWCKTISPTFTRRFYSSHCKVRAEIFRVWSIVSSFSNLNEDSLLEASSQFITWRLSPEWAQWNSLSLPCFPPQPNKSLFPPSSAPAVASQSFWSLKSKFSRTFITAKLLAWIYPFLCDCIVIHSTITSSLLSTFPWDLNTHTQLYSFTEV